MNKPVDKHIRNPSGSSVPMEHRAKAKEEVLAAVADRYPENHGRVWNLSVIDQILENPGKYPTMHGILDHTPATYQRKVVTCILRDAKFVPEKIRRGSASHFFARPQQEATA